MYTRITMPLVLAAIACLLVSSPGFSQVVGTYVPDVPAPWGVEFDAEGNLYVSGRVAETGFIRRIPADGGPATTISGSFSYLTGMATAANGDLYVADLGIVGGAGPGRIWKVTPAGVKTLVVNGSGLSNPAFMEFDAAGNLLISDRTQVVMWSLSPAGVVSPYCFSLGASGEWAGQFVIEPNGDVIIAVGPYIKRVGPGGSPVTIVASGLGSVQGLVRGPEGDFIISRAGSSELWRVSEAGVATPWAGSTSGCADGNLANAKFGSPQDLATFESRVFIADRTCNSVRVIETPTPVHETSWGRIKSAYR